MTIASQTRIKKTDTATLLMKLHTKCVFKKIVYEQGKVSRNGETSQLRYHQSSYVSARQRIVTEQEVAFVVY
jgi:hypothetical protein